MYYRSPKLITLFDAIQLFFNQTRVNALRLFFFNQCHFISNEVFKVRIIYYFISLFFNQRCRSERSKYSCFLIVPFKVDPISDSRREIFASFKSQTVVGLNDKKNVSGVG